MTEVTDRHILDPTPPDDNQPRSGSCLDCGRRWTDTDFPPGVKVLFHNCSTSPVNRPPPRQPPAQVSREWARSIIGQAIADAIDQEELLRRIDHEDEKS